MRSGLFIFGMIFLAVGGLLYFIPMQRVSADTTTTGDGTIDIRTSSAGVTVPVEWAYTSLILGLFLTVAGLVAPSPKVRPIVKNTIIKSDQRRNSRNNNNQRRSSYEKVESKNQTSVGSGKNKKVIREHTEKHISRSN